MKLMDRNIFRKYIKVFFAVYGIFVIMYLVGFTIDNFSRLYILVKSKFFLIVQLYYYSVLLSLFYIFPFAVTFSFVFFYIYLYLKKDNISIFTSGYSCRPFKIVTAFTLTLLCVCAYLYYEVVFTKVHSWDRKLSVKLKQNSRYSNSIVEIQNMKGKLYILSKVFDIKNNRLEDIYCYRVNDNFELFAKRGYLLTNLLIIRKAKIRKQSELVSRDRFVLKIVGLKKVFREVFMTIESLSIKTLISYFISSSNKVFLFEIFRRTTYVLNGWFVGLLLLTSFVKIVYKVNFYKFVTFFILSFIAFISIYFFIFLLSKNLFNVFVGIILWLWSYVVFIGVNKKVLENEF